MIGLRAWAQHGVLHLDEVADFDASAEPRSGPQPREGTDHGAGADPGAFEMTEGPDLRAVGAFDIGAADNVRADRPVANDPGVMTEPAGRRDEPTGEAAGRERGLEEV